MKKFVRFTISTKSRSCVASRGYLNQRFLSAVQPQLFYRQEIPAGSRSGVQRHGGDAVFYMLEGYTEVDGVRHVWKGGDVMTLPVFPDGVIYRHVNIGSAPVRLICIERNLVHTVGVDRQSGFEQLQPCPEYRQSQSA